MEANRDLAVFKNAHFEAEQKHKALIEQLKVGNLLLSLGVSTLPATILRDV